MARILTRSLNQPSAYHPTLPHSNDSVKWTSAAARRNQRPTLPSTLTSASTIAPVATMWLRVLLVLVMGVLLLPSSNRVVHALPPGFVEEYIANVLNPIDLTFLPPLPGPNQQAPMMVTSKLGRIFLILDHENSDALELDQDAAAALAEDESSADSSATTTPTPTTLSPPQVHQVADLSQFICTDGARGVMSIAPHPAFSPFPSGRNRWIYVFYTKKEGDASDFNCVNTLSRFPMKYSNNSDSDNNNNTPHPDDYQFDMSQEHMLLQIPPMPGDVHLGSDMVFGNDGNLWITSGDNGAPFDDAVSQDLYTLWGKLIRITPGGGIPGDNPYKNHPRARRCHLTGGRRHPSSQTVCSEIYAVGLRSPFKMALDPNTPASAAAQGHTRLRFSDVGSNMYEELNDAGTDYKGANYGWPYIEGPCNRTHGAPFRVCTEAATEGFGFTDPAHWYKHDELGGAAVGGAFVPNGVFPAEYDGTYLHTDYTHNEVYHLVYDEKARCRDCPEPAHSGYVNTTFYKRDRVVALEFGPYKDTQALYVLDRAKGAAVRRIRYVGGSNIAPAAFLQLNMNPDPDDIGVRSVSDILPNEPVLLDASQSTDLDNDVLYYEWDFGDGSDLYNSFSNATVEHIYKLAGVYEVVVMVTDGQGARNEARLQIQVGRHPTVNLESPVVGTTFAVDDVFDLVASAVDANTGLPLPDASLTWEILRHHNTHYHPWLAPTTGNNLFTREAPEPEDFAARGNSYMEIQVTATDATGLFTTASVNLQPRTVPIVFQISPASIREDMVATAAAGGDGIPATPIVLQVFGAAVEPNEEIIMWENHQFDVIAPEIPGYDFVEWSDGQVDRTRMVTAPRADSLLPDQPFTLTMVYQKFGEAYQPYLLINCGALHTYFDGVNRWSIDKYYTGGLRNTVPLPILKGDIPRILRKRRIGSMDNSVKGEGGPDHNIYYKIPVPNKGKYKVRLHFIDFIKEQAGERLFSVKIENQVVLSSFDIFVQAGGSDREVVREFEVVVDDGILTIDFLAEVDVPEISAIAIYSLVTEFEPDFFVNCGSEESYYDGNHTWLSDTDYKGGFEPISTAAEVENTDHPGLIATRRQGNTDVEAASGDVSNLVYTIPVYSKGIFRVDLYFAEFENQAVDSRLFHVNIEDVEELSSLDIYAEAGFRTALTKQVYPDVRGGSLKIEFVPQIGRPEISAIAVYRSSFTSYINCGSMNDYDDGTRVWQADRFVQGGRNRNTRLEAKAPDPTLVQRRRQGGLRGDLDPNIVYNIPVPTSGDYKVELYFVEFIHREPERRQFMVWIEGSFVLRKYDTYADAGFQELIIRPFFTTVKDGLLTIEIIPLVDRPEIAGIVVTKIS